MNNCKRQKTPVLNGLWTNYRVIEIVSSDGFKDLVTFGDKVGLGRRCNRIIHILLFLMIERIAYFIR